MARAPVLPVALAAALLAGCGGGSHADAPVRALMDRYLAAMMRHDWVQACALLTPEAAELRHRSTPSTDCPSAESWDAGGALAGDPHAHPELAGAEFAQVRIGRIEVRRDSALIHIKEPRFDEFTLLAVRRKGTWLLAQDLEIGIPYSEGPTALPPATSAP